MENKKLLWAISELIGWVQYMEESNQPLQLNNSLEELQELLEEHELTITEFLTEE